MSLSTPTTDGGRVESFVDTSSGPPIIRLQKYDAAGHAVGGELRFNDHVTGQYDVAALPGGGYVVIFQSVSPGGSWGSLSVQDANGAVLNQSSTAAGNDFHLTVGSTGDFLVSFHGIPADSGLDTSTPLLELYDSTGHSLNHGHIQLAGQVTAITPGANGVFSIGWNDGGTTRTFTFDPGTAGALSTPTKPGVTVVDDVGAQTGAVATGATTDDATPTVRISVAQAGEAFVELDKDQGSGAGVHYDNQGGGIVITAEDVARGYIDIPLHTSGDGHYVGWVRVTDASGSASYPQGLSFNLQAPASPPPPPPPSSPGQVLTSQQAGATLTGGAGNDTLNASQGPDHLTGGGGADAFVFAHEPWAPAHITDFAVGTDRLDLSGMLHDAGYTGSNPVADKYVWLQDDGAGGTQILFDKDGAAQGQQWPDYVIHLDGVAASGLTWAKLTGSAGTTTSPPPPASPPPVSPPPASSGQTLTANDGGSHLTGGSGDDTLTGAHGPDVMTGAGGVDHFVFKVIPWSAGEVTDFTSGVDKIDVSALLTQAHYSGADPVADGYLKLIDDGHGNSWLYFDSDGRGTADAWGSFIATLDHVSPTAVRPGDWIIH